MKLNHPLQIVFSLISIFWIFKCVANSESANQVALGKEYLLGINGKSVEITKALEIFEKAGDEGDDEALFELGQLYEVTTNFYRIKLIFFLSLENL